jgi:hypothetical protein
MACGSTKRGIPHGRKVAVCVSDLVITARQQYGVAGAAAAPDANLRVAGGSGIGNTERRQ